MPFCGIYIWIYFTCVFLQIDVLGLSETGVALFPLGFHGFSTKVFSLDSTLQIDECDMLGVWWQVFVCLKKTSSFSI